MTKEDRRRETTKKRHQKAIELFDEMYAKRKHGKRLYTFEYCLAEVADQMDYSPETIRNIVNLRTC